MATRYTISGRYKLRGAIRVNGSKNAALAMVAATLLTDKPCVIRRVPAIGDVSVLLDILRHLGAVVESRDHSITIQTAKITTTQIPDELAGKLRASILLLGPLLTRIGRVTTRHPGGCVLGKRPVGTHFDALTALGAHFEQDENYYHGRVGELKGANIYLGEASVTATENTLMAAVLAEGVTSIEPAACEPHVTNLGRMLMAMGARIEGLGTHRLVVHGVNQLKGGVFDVNADEIEAGTLAIALSLTGGKGVVEDVEPADLRSIAHKLNQFGITTRFERAGSRWDMAVDSIEQLQAASVQINIWPMLPTDIQPQMTVVATQAEGTSLVHDWMYDRRLMYIDELVKMGANILLCDPHRALVAGPTKLHGTTIMSPDIRAGMAFVLAGLVAHGTTTIEHAEMIERGYEDIVHRLGALGAKIERRENEY